jgi:hypothetical protein
MLGVSMFELKQTSRQAVQFCSSPFHAFIQVLFSICKPGVAQYHNEISAAINNRAAENNTGSEAGM